MVTLQQNHANRLRSARVQKPSSVAPIRESTVVHCSPRWIALLHAVAASALWIGDVCSRGADQLAVRCLAAPMTIAAALFLIAAVAAAARPSEG